MTHQHRVRSAYFSDASSICDEPPMPIRIHTRTHVQTVVFQDEMQPNSRARVVTQSLDSCQEHYFRKRVRTPIAVQPKISELTVTLSDSAFAADVQSRSEIRNANKASLLILARRAASNINLSLHVTPSSCCSELLLRPAGGHITTAAAVNLCSGAHQLPAERDDLSQLHNRAYSPARPSHKIRGMSSTAQRKLNKVDSVYYTVRTPSKPAPANQLWQRLDASKVTPLLWGASSDSTSTSKGRKSHDRVMRYRDDSDSDVDYTVPDCASSIRSVCRESCIKMAPSAMQGSQSLTRGQSLIAEVKFPILLISSRDTDDDSMPNVVSDSSTGSTGDSSSHLHNYGHTSKIQRQLCAQVVGGFERVSVQKEALNATTASLQVDIHLLHQQLIALEIKLDSALMQSNGGHQIKGMDPTKWSAPSLPARSFSGSATQCQMSVARLSAISKSHAVRELYTSVSHNGLEDEVEDMRLMQKYGM